MKNNLITPNKPSVLMALFFLGFLEYCLAAVLILWIAPDSNNAIIFGYSLGRLVVVFFALLVAGWFLLLTFHEACRARIVQMLESAFRSQPDFWELIIFLLTLLSLIILITPFEILGKYGLCFENVRTLLFFLCLTPFQISLGWIKRGWHLDWTYLRPVVIFLSIILALGCFIVFSKLGITPEQEHWNIGGNPLTFLQLLSILFIGIFIWGLFGLIKRDSFVKKGVYFDLFILIALFAGTVLCWQETPVPHNEFSTRSMAPYYQSFPASDARVHDAGALAVLNGAGILFKEFTDKPLYITFLAILHIFAGYDYNFLIFLHICFMALMVPSLFIIGKSFHSRLFGFLLAGIVLLRQQNAILLSNVFNFNALPTQLMTEVPTLLGLIIVTGALFYWLKALKKNAWFAFVAGGVMGVASLVRLNPFLLILATPVFLFLAMIKNKKDWLIHCMFFVLGCLILVVPWMFTGTNQLGQSFLILKFQDIINVRYGPSGSLPLEKDVAFLPDIHLNSAATPINDPETISPLSAGPSLPPLDVHTFPGFVINHTLHNFVGSLLTLPDSLQPDEQKLAVLVKRPYWILGIELLAPSQIPFILLNICLLAIGLGWSWKRWTWAGLSPLFVFIVYSLSLGLGRTSGSRYLVPIDWIVDFYFALGLICLFRFLPKQLREMLQADVQSDEYILQPETTKPSRMVICAVVVIFCISTLIPAAQLLVPPRKALCQHVSETAFIGNKPLNNAVQNTHLAYGEILYPEIAKGHLAFTLLTCERASSFEITGFHEKLDVGQRVIAGFSDESQQPTLEFIALPVDGTNPAQVIWAKEVK